MTKSMLAVAALLLMGAGPDDTPRMPAATAPGATVVGCGVTVTEAHALGVGIGSTMATLHADGTWTVAWSEVDRVAALDPADHQQCFSQLVVPFARMLQAGRGRLKESP